MSFTESISSVFSKYATFSGRARRSEFWWFYLFNVLVNIVLGLINVKIITSLWSLAILLPSLAVTVRRLHDTGKSGWYILIPIVVAIIACVIIVLAEASVAGMIIAYAMIIVVMILYIIWLVKDSQPGDNQYGPNPKDVTVDAA